MRNSTSLTTTLCFALACSLSACTGMVGDGDEAPDTAPQFIADVEGGGGSVKYALDISHWSEVITDAEVDCWWDQGVRHVISGTQSPQIARQQLAQAYAAGMTIDLYVWLFWDKPITDQVENALALAADLPIGRLWLDAEENPGDLSASGLEDLLDEAIEACGSFNCGIYTGKGWWMTHLPNTTDYAHLPLWYAHYDDNPNLSSWSEDAFGGWAAPTGKQFATSTVCGVTVDENMIAVYQAAPPRPEPPGPVGDGPPARPTGLYPDEGLQYWTNTLRILCDTVPGATDYAFEVEFYYNGQFRPYTTFDTTTNVKEFHPNQADTHYRWRVTASNAHGDSPPSPWAWFEYGSAGEEPEWPAEDPPPADSPEDPPPADPPEDPPPADPPPLDPGDPPPQGTALPGAPTGVLPAHGAILSGSSITMACDPYYGAQEYRFEIEWYNGSSWTPYTAYTNTVPSKTFYPSVHDVPYRFRVQANTGAGWKAPSAWNAVLFGNGQWP